MSLTFLSKVDQGLLLFLMNIVYYRKTMDQKGTEFLLPSEIHRR